MSDYTICRNENCPAVDNCWRYGMPYDLHHQSYQNFIPEQNDENDFKCSMFIEYPEPEYNPKEGDRFARKCSITGEGMNDGWFVVDESDDYFKYEKDILKICIDAGYENLEDAYEDDFMYYTDWDVETDCEYIFTNGHLVEFNSI